MRPILPLLLPLLLAACGPASQAPQAPATAEAPAPRLDFAGKARIPVRLEMHPSDDGGRAVPLGGAWRGQLEFDGGDAPRCGIDRGGLPELVPGSTYEVHVVCATAVQLPDDGRRGLRVMEDGRPIASGVVLP